MLDKDFDNLKYLELLVEVLTRENKDLCLFIKWRANIKPVKITHFGTCRCNICKNIKFERIICTRPYPPEGNDQA